MQLPSRASLARFAAPAAFLLAVTIAVLLVRSALLGAEDEASTPTVTATETTPTTTERTTTQTTTTTPEEEPRFYTIESGDTYNTIAAEFDTSVERLVELNPGVDPTQLRVGQRIRVG